MRLLLALFLAVVVAVPSVKALPIRAKGNLTLLVKDWIYQGDDFPTTEEVVKDAGDSGVETLDTPEEGVQSKIKLCDTAEVEAEDHRNGGEIQESDQDSTKGSEPAESNSIVVEADSSEESSNEDGSDTSSEATEDQDSQDEVAVDVSEKSKGRIIENSSKPVQSKNKATANENKNSTDSTLEKRDTEVVSESSPEEENAEVLAQTEPLADDTENDSETSDLEFAQSEINEIIFGKEEDSVEEIDTEEGSDVSDSEPDGTQIEEVDSEEASTDHETGESLVQKQKPSVEELPDDGEVVTTDKPRILSPAEFFGHFEDDDSAPAADEDD